MIVYNMLHLSGLCLVDSNTTVECIHPLTTTYTQHTKDYCHQRHWMIRISFLCSWMLWLCCCQTKLWGVGAFSPDVSQGVRPLRLIRLIRGSNLAGWHWTLHSMRLSSENSQDGWALHSPDRLRPACSSSALTCERLGRVGSWLWYCVSVLNQNRRLKKTQSHWAFSDRS